jgi:hypothetical protein
MRVSFIIPAYTAIQDADIEVPIACYGRTYEEGKNITWRDGFKAIYVLLRIRVGA